jgi:hypothetical protein
MQLTGPFSLWYSLLCLLFCEGRTSFQGFPWTLNKNMRHALYYYRMPVPLWPPFKGPKTGSLFNGIKDQRPEDNLGRDDSTRASRDYRALIDIFAPSRKERLRWFDPDQILLQSVLRRQR